MANDTSKAFRLLKIALLNALLLGCVEDETRSRGFDSSSMSDSSAGWSEPDASRVDRATLPIGFDAAVTTASDGDLSFEPNALADGSAVTLCGACPPHLACDEPSGTCRKKAVSMVPMDDGTLLWTEVLLPAGSQQDGWPTLMTRTPYDQTGSFFAEAYDRAAAYHTERGYAFVLQHVRGRHRSGGHPFEPTRWEIVDGQSTVAWIKDRPWSNGHVGTIGCSYDGFTAVAAAVGNPGVDVIIADDTPTDFGFDLRGGTINLHILKWLYLLQDPDQEWPEVDVIEIMTNTLDLSSLDMRFLHHEDRFWRELVDGQTPEADFFAERTVANRLSEICSPALVVFSPSSLWNDPLNIFRGLRDQGCAEHFQNHRLVITPEAHCTHSSLLGVRNTPVNQLIVQYIDQHLGHRETDLSTIPHVQLRTAGDEAFEGAEDWPVPTEETRLYLSTSAMAQHSGTLSKRPPDETEEDVLLVEPKHMNPCSANVEDAYPYAYYTYGPLEAPVEIRGPISAKIFIRTSVSDVDVFIALYAFNPAAPNEAIPITHAGHRARFRNGFGRAEPLVPDEITPMTVTTPTTVYRLESGSTLGLVVVTGLCGFCENPMTGENPTAQTRWETANLAIVRGGRAASYISIPVVP